ncbi:Flp pilus assembly protein CpaB [Lentibacillus salicampi]|uniref:Flp pilus assembly protein CpaB n=1 Tax=Lentibacillus salicampi TaxID=175306 RepID=A0A4Y9A791_9BACI|nr:SAF domain-containing protein [Lentibacillus salicampi]TFJ91618.1 flp pilus assembly protein CpaB [Lentibacillus salicampi]
MLESKRRAIIFFSLAIILAAVSGFLVLKKVQAINTDLGTIVTVYTADREVSSREVITPDDVTTDEIPQQYLRDEHITDVEELMNKVSVVPLSAGDIITDNILKDASAVTEANNRLVSVFKSEKVSFDEELTALDRVDIIVSHTFEDDPVTEVFMEDVKVARTANNEDGDFAGVQLEIPYESVSKLIHMQNYADSLRLVKANVAEEEQQKQGSEESGQTENTADENNDETNNDSNNEEESEESNDDNNNNEDKDNDDKNDKKDKKDNDDDN